MGSTRSVEINTLIDRGDWDGVVAAASRYAEVDTNASSTIADTEGEIVDDHTIEEGTSSNAGAANMAADWAIDQGLAALQKAEEDDQDSGDTNQERKDDGDGDGESL